MQKKSLNILLIITLISLSNSSVYAAQSKLADCNLKEITSPGQIDLLWNKYFSTNDNVYLEKLLKFMNEDDFMLYTGYETLNRAHLNRIIDSVSGENSEKIDNKDILESIKKYCKNDSSAGLKKVELISAAISSIQNYSRKPEVDKTINNIIAKHPEWDYGAKIKSDIGE